MISGAAGYELVGFLTNADGFTSELDELKGILLDVMTIESQYSESNLV